MLLSPATQFLKNGNQIRTSTGHVVLIAGRLDLIRALFHNPEPLQSLESVGQDIGRYPLSTGLKISIPPLAHKKISNDQKTPTIS